MFKKLLQRCFFIVTILCYCKTEGGILVKRSTDNSVHGYLTERTCWWNEVCKEEFQSLFRCKCPEWNFCRSPGRYYNAVCSMTNTGYIWTQPGLRQS
ncbi:uncharacterized protein LOC115885431 [Sitophilus oryzae]|uniref:Uncharacterized protein LOC115885431 n=1 Tax=Sitophilus oryzae TaxID=7048 RepID=A0A6J2YAE8_SITOR|nr:uncharacterized protein LOC115885431 [Sitophilus oryzae]